MTLISESQIRSCDVFRQANENTIASLIANSRLVNFVKNRQIVGQADPSTDVYLVVDGIVRAKSYSEKGKEVSYLDIKPGELFGEFSAQIFRDSILGDPNTAMALIELLIEKNRALTERIHEFGTMAVRFRVQSELLRLAEAVSDDDAESVSFDIPTHSELANRVCTHREAVTKELNYLASFGLFKIVKSIVHVKDYQRFRQVAGHTDW